MILEETREKLLSLAIEEKEYEIHQHTLDFNIIKHTCIENNNDSNTILQTVAKKMQLLTHQINDKMNKI